MLDRLELCECGVERAKSERLPNALHPLSQIGDGQRETRRCGERALLIDEIIPVEGEEDLGGAGERAERASASVMSRPIPVRPAIA
jgi:hypothetical protein